MFFSLFLSASAAFFLLPPPFLGSSYLEFIFLKINAAVLSHPEFDVFSEVYLQKYRNLASHFPGFGRKVLCNLGLCRLKRRLQGCRVCGS